MHCCRNILHPKLGIAEAYLNKLHDLMYAAIIICAL
jgi:hypothetical protein